MSTEKEESCRRVDEECKRTDEQCKRTDEGGEKSEKACLKAAKKAAEKAEKERKKAEREAAVLAQQAAAAAVLNRQVKDAEKDVYGHLGPLKSEYRTKREWVRVGEIGTSLEGSSFWVRARIEDSRCGSKHLVFVVLRWQTATIQGVMVTGKDDGPTDPSSSVDGSTEDKPGVDAIKFVASLPLESLVDVFVCVRKPPEAILSTTQQAVELAILKCHCVSRAAVVLPFQLKDANRREDDEDGIQVMQDTRLDNRILDLRTQAMHAVMHISSAVSTFFREALLKQGFLEIHSPKLQGGASEGGSNVFKLSYFGREACLAQSPQLYKQMAISGDLERVFEVGPVFRAENSNTHRHLCEFTGLDMEMAFKEHYYEVLEVIEEMFAYIFRGLETHCQPHIDVVHRQWPATPFRWRLPGVRREPSWNEDKDVMLRLDFREGCTMLRNAGYAVPEDISHFDLNTEQEKALGRLVSEKYATDFYYMINYPLAVRPFYTMPHPTEDALSNSYDFFMRGEEIVSGAQRIHDPMLLADRATDHGIGIQTIKDYLDSFRLGAHPHAGCGVGLERVVMLYLGLNNIRKVSMFPRDPKRLSP